MDPEPSLFFSYTIDVNLVFGIAGIVVLLFCIGLISGAEVALLSLSQNDNEAINHENSSKGKIMEAFLDKPKKLVTSLLVANNFLNISIILMFYVVIETIFSHINTTIFKFGLEILIAPFLIVLFGVVIPKVYARRNGLKFSLLIVYPIVFLDKLLSPISLPVRSTWIYLHSKWAKQKTNFSVNQIKGVSYVKDLLPHINTNEFDDESINFFLN